MAVPRVFRCLLKTWDSLGGPAQSQAQNKTSQDEAHLKHFLCTLLEPHLLATWGPETWQRRKWTSANICLRSGLAWPGFCYGSSDIWIFGPRRAVRSHQWPSQAYIFVWGSHRIFLAAICLVIVVLLVFVCKPQKTTEKLKACTEKYSWK